MARASAAINMRASVQRQALGHIAATSVSRRYEAAEAALRRSLPFLILLFIGVLAAGAVMQARESHDRALAATAAEMDLLTSLLAADFDALAAAAPQDAPAAHVKKIVAKRGLAEGRLIVVTDRLGAIAASAPAAPVALASLVDLFEPEPTVRRAASQPDVIRAVLHSGADSFASVRSLALPHGQIALILPLDPMLRDWWLNALRSGFLLASACIVLAAICAAYLWQAARARELDCVAQTLRTRVDIALSRGRCGLWDWDIGHGRLYWSDSMYELLGMQPAATYLSVNELRALVHEDDGLLSSFADSLKSGASAGIDKVFRLRNSVGEWVWLRARAQIVKNGDNEDAGTHLVGIAVDVSAEVKNSDQAKAADLRLRDAVEAISDAFVLWDADGKLVLSNSKFQELRNSGIFGGRSDRTRGAARQAAANSEKRTPDGKWFQFDERPTKDGGFVSVGRDVTAFKLHEAELLTSGAKLTATVEALQRSRQALEAQAQQLAEIAERYLEEKATAENANMAKAEFLANMSHELRTPLNAIIGFSEMMENEVFGALGSDRYGDYVGHIRKSGEHLMNLVTDILDMSQLESGRMRLHRTDFRIAPVIRDCAAGFGIAARAKQIHIKGDGWPDVSLNADKAAIDRVLRTLIGNAVKFTPAGGKISVRARLMGDAVNIYVEDSGAGIPRGAVSRIGRPFVQVESKLEDGMKGSGLGLAIARSLVELHGGSVRIRSVEGSGTIVMVHLPGAGVLPAQLVLDAG